MAGGHMKYRALSRDSAHRQALLRNLVTSLIKEESIHTTWPKAKEAQRLAEKLITMAKKNNEQARRNAQAIFYVSSPSLHLLCAFHPFNTLADASYNCRPPTN
jgi:large subunit ribosomal protein L17